MPLRSRGSSVRRALATSAGKFPTIAVVRGPDRSVYATTGSGFVDLGGQVIDDPAVTASPDQLWFLAKGTNSLLYIRSADTGWQYVNHSHVLGTGLTVDYDPSSGFLNFTYLDRNSLVHIGTIDPLATSGPWVIGDYTGPPSYGATTTSARFPLYIGANYTPGLLGATGNLMQWDANDYGLDPASSTKRSLSCARDRFATAMNPGYPSDPVGAVACRSADSSNSVNFLGKQAARNLGGHIIGSPGLALRTTNDTDAMIYVTGTDHAVWSTSVTDTTASDGHDLISSTPFVRIGGYASGGVQAVSFSLSPDLGNPV